MKVIDVRMSNYMYFLRELVIYPFVRYINNFKAINHYFIIPSNRKMAVEWNGINFHK